MKFVLVLPILFGPELPGGFSSDERGGMENSAKRNKWKRGEWGGWSRQGGLFLVCLDSNSVNS